MKEAAVSKCSYSTYPGHISFCCAADGDAADALGCDVCMPSTDLATIYGRAGAPQICPSVTDTGHTDRTRRDRGGRVGPTRMIHVILATSDCDGRRCLPTVRQSVTRDFLSVGRDGVLNSDDHAVYRSNKPTSLRGDDGQLVQQFTDKQLVYLPETVSGICVVVTHTQLYFTTEMLQQKIEKNKT